MAESRKGLKKVTENRKNQKSSAENRKNHLCRKPENDIYKSRKPGKIGKYGGNRKAQFKICGNRKSPFGSCGKPEKPKKTMKSCGNRNIRKNTESWKRNSISCGNPETDPLLPSLIDDTTRQILNQHLFPFPIISFHFHTEIGILCAACYPFWGLILCIPLRQYFLPVASRPY